MFSMQTRMLAAMAACLTTACLKPTPPPRVQATTKPKSVEKPQVRAKALVTAINLTNLFTLQQGDRVLLYDARPAFVYAFGHLPAAVNWPRSSFDSGLSAHEPEIKAAIQAGRTIVLYCTDAACPDARAMAEQLAKLGYPISVLDGGFAAWKEADLPTE